LATEVGVTDTKTRIVGTAGELFRRKGYVGTGLKQIVAESGAPFGSIYHFFPGGKQQLAAEVIRTSGRAYQDLVMAILDQAPDALTAVQTGFAHGGRRCGRGERPRRGSRGVIERALVRPAGGRSKVALLQ